MCVCVIIRNSETSKWRELNYTRRRQKKWRQIHKTHKKKTTEDMKAEDSNQLFLFPFPIFYNISSIHSFIHKCTLDDSSFYLFYPITCICILFSISYLNTILYHHHVLTIVCVEYLVINPTGREGVWIRNILSDLHKLLCSNSHLSIYLYVYPVISFIPLGGSVKKCA